MVFLARQATYTVPVLDPWFKAATPLTQDVINTELHESAMQTYAASDPVSVLGCLEQTELCNPNIADPLVRVILPTECNIADQTAGLEFNDKQMATAERLYESITRTAHAQSVYSLGGAGMLAASYIQDNLSPGLPDDQWRLEAQNWFSTSLTALQLWTVQYVTGYGRADFNKYVTPPPPADKWMCSNQIVQRSDFSSFSVLGLATILAVCGSIIFLSETVSRVLPAILRNSAAKRRRAEEWQAYDILQLRCAPVIDAMAQSNEELALKVPTSLPYPTSSSKFPMRWLKFRWPLQRTKSPNKLPIHQSDSPVSATTMLRSEKMSTPTSADSETASSVTMLCAEIAYVPYSFDSKGIEK